jgi:hypothetical protein
MVLLTEHTRKLETDLAAAKDSYTGVKALILDHAIAQGAMEENEKKAREELEKEKTRSHGSIISSSSTQLACQSEVRQP